MADVNFRGGTVYASLNPRHWFLDLATFSRKKKKCCPRDGNKFSEKLKMLPSGFFMSWHRRH